MPAKKRITRRKMIQAAVELLRSGGEKAINARSIAKKLSCSTQPIYSEFASMNDLKNALREEAGQRYIDYVKMYMDMSAKQNRYKAYGLGYVRFAREEKELFRYIYFRDRGKDNSGIEDINIDSILDSMCEDYGYDRETAARFHAEMAVYSYGLAMLVNSGYLAMDDKEISGKLEQEFRALCSFFGNPPLLNKSGRK